MFHLEEIITMAHGSGGESTSRLISEVFAAEFSNEYLAGMEDASVVPVSSKIAMTTDSFVVTPYEYPGGNIGRLSVCGTVNDLLTSGAVPKYLTAGFILEEGLPVSSLIRVVKSMAETAREAGVIIVTGDTKVIESASKDGGVMINTAGVGVINENAHCYKATQVKPGDVIILSGTLGEHHATILSRRMGLDNESLESDNAPLVDIVHNLEESEAAVHAIRDVTRGGLATVLNEYAKTAGVQIVIRQDSIPVKKAVKDFCGILGLDPLYMGNEGKMAIAVDPADAAKALEIIRGSKYGADAAIIGSVIAVPEEEKPALLLETTLGGRRIMGPLYGEGLPRIC
ncbi:MAG: hydrogenase expression/formation protein HypE [Lachnospiraceae bacterium]|nr:hydrogenase expression/formation protein HypE [Lachnospiraceae bacterium]